MLTVPIIDWYVGVSFFTLSAISGFTFDNVSMSTSRSTESSNWVDLLARSKKPRDFCDSRANENESHVGSSKSRDSQVRYFSSKSIRIKLKIFLTASMVFSLEHSISPKKHSKPSVSILQTLPRLCKILPS